MNKNPYPYLRKTFEGFVSEKTGALKDVWQNYAFLQQFKEFNHRQQEHSIQDVFGQSTREIYLKYIAPWEELTQEQALVVAKLWSHTQSIEKNLLMDIRVIRDFKALFWTMVNVYELRFFELFVLDLETELNRPMENWDWITHLFVAPEYSLPYRQCFYCGRLEQDPRGHVFGKQKLFYCHLAECDTSDRNPSAHPAGCCFKAWERERQNLRDRCKRQSKEPQKVIQTFLDFCEYRYLANQSIQIPIQVQKEKPLEWTSIADKNAIQVYQAS